MQIVAIYYKNVILYTLQLLLTRVYEERYYIKKKKYFSVRTSRARGEKLAKPREIVKHDIMIIILYSTIVVVVKEEKTICSPRTVSTLFVLLTILYYIHYTHIYGPLEQQCGV